MSIGTAKPDATQLNTVVHHMINNKDITELYGAGHYEKDVIQLLDQLFQSHDVVFLTGGSGLYIDAVLRGVDDFAEVPIDIRNELNQAYAVNGLSWLKEEILKHDPEFALTADLSNPQRLIRALEVCLFTGKPFSSFLNKNTRQRNFIPIKILVNTERGVLYQRINDRVDNMMAAGLLEEIKQLLPYKHQNALKTVGYRELFDYLDDKSGLEEAIEKIKQHTRNYAKRQITWFRNRDDFKEFDPAQKEKLILYIEEKMKE